VGEAVLSRDKNGIFVALAAVFEVKVAMYANV
jgi:hypothetical protein